MERGHSAALKRKKEAETSKNAMESMTYFVWSFEKAKELNWSETHEIHWNWETLIYSS